MSDENPDRSDPNDEYPLGPPGKTLADYEYSVYPLYREPKLEEPAEKKPPLQFTLAQLLWAMTFVAVGLSLLQCIPLDHSQSVAAAAGVTLLLSIIVLEAVKPDDRRVYVVWWIGVGIYVASSIMAIMRG